MSKPLLNRKRAKWVALLFFLLGLVIVTYFGAWWPGIMLAVGLPLALLQYLGGRHFDMVVTLFVFLGAWITVQFQIKWEIVLPVIFAIGGIYVFFKEWTRSSSEEEEEFEAQKKEIDNTDDE